MSGPNEDHSGLWTTDGISRCWWCHGHSDYEHYHDCEWGIPISDDDRLFEKVCLEGFQSGLSWLTILRKRDNFREAFRQFRFEEVAGFTQRDVSSLLRNSGIVRHRGKIEATISNAARAVEMAEEHGSLAAWFWQFEPPEQQQNPPEDKAAACARTTVPAATKLSAELKKLGWKFVGPTTMYAFMQSVGMVNDHIKGCSTFRQVTDARKAFSRPTLPGAA